LKVWDMLNWDRRTVSHLSDDRSIWGGEREG